MQWICTDTYAVQVLPPSQPSSSAPRPTGTTTPQTICCVHKASFSFPSRYASCTSLMGLNLWLALMLTPRRYFAFLSFQGDSSFFAFGCPKPHFTLKIISLDSILFPLAFLELLCSILRVVMGQEPTNNNITSFAAEDGAMEICSQHIIICCKCDPSLAYH